MVGKSVKNATKRSWNVYAFFSSLRFLTGNFWKFHQKFQHKLKKKQFMNLQACPLQVDVFHLALLTWLLWKSLSAACRQQLFLGDIGPCTGGSPWMKRRLDTTCQTTSRRGRIRCISMQILWMRAAGSWIGQMRHYLRYTHLHCSTPPTQSDAGVVPEMPQNTDPTRSAAGGALNRGTEPGKTILHKRCSPINSIWPQQTQPKCSYLLQGR